MSDDVMLILRIVFVCIYFQIWIIISGTVTQEAAQNYDSSPRQRERDDDGQNEAEEGDDTTDQGNDVTG